MDREEEPIIGIVYLQEIVQWVVGGGSIESGNKRVL